ncbi:MAG: cytochrome c [Alicyclobacillaceae bacterium]|nr:cytochrome c [Alicyclobacillaceae bacterium]
MKKTLAILAAGALLVLAGCGANSSQPSTGASNTSSPSSGQSSSSTSSGSSTSSQSTQGSGGENKGNATALYQQNCQACHGMNLEGGMGPALDKVGSKLSEDQIKQKIETGGGMMPAFKSTLKGEEIEALAKWLAAKK